jgi:hypothetical protein
MRWLDKLLLRLRSVFRRNRVEQELGDEIRFHLEAEIEEKVVRGMAPEEARFAVLRELGGVEQIKEECRDVRRVNFVEHLLQDLGYGLRQLRRNPGFTTVALVTLTLGVAANTTIFSAVSAILLAKPPVRDPDRLCAVSSTHRVRGGISWTLPPQTSSRGKARIMFLKTWPPRRPAARSR